VLAVLVYKFSRLLVVGEEEEEHIGYGASVVDGGCGPCYPLDGVLESLVFVIRRSPWYIIKYKSLLCGFSFLYQSSRLNISLLIQHIITRPNFSLSTLQPLRSIDPSSRVLDSLPAGCGNLLEAYSKFYSEC
jgi:hypothetical protein